MVVGKTFDANTEARTIGVDDVKDDDMIFDVGPETSKAIDAIVAQAGTIVWNGPLGVFEFDAFAGGTERLAKAIASGPGFSIAGGGDTLAAIAKFGIEDKVGYISTGGGAFLEFLEGKTFARGADPRRASQMIRRSREGGNPVTLSSYTRDERRWVPAFAGTTDSSA